MPLFGRDEDMSTDFQVKLEFGSEIIRPILDMRISILVLTSRNHVNW